MRKMRTRNSMRIVVLSATLATVSVAAVAQTQTQGQGQQNQQNQTQQNQQGQQNQQNQTQQNQQGQPAQKQSIWQRLKNSAKQAGQNTVQEGTQQAQQGAQQVQQGVQQVQQLPGGGNQQANAGFGGGSCGPNCFDAGPFQANVSQMTMSQQGPWHIIRMDIQFRNATNQPLIIAYHDGSMVMVDNNGSTYQGAGGSPGELQGMGIDRGNQTDSQFVLGPGQTGNALFSVARARGNDSPIGTGFTYNFTIDELQAQNGAQAIPVRQYNLNFPSLAPGSSNAAFASGSPANGKGASVGGTPAAGYAVGAGNVVAPQANPQVGTAVQRGVSTPAAQQQGTVNGRPGRPVVTTPPSTAVNKAAIKSTATTTTPPAAVKPIPATTKKSTATTGNQANTTTTNNK